MGSASWKINGVHKTCHLAEKRLCGLVRKKIHLGHIKWTKNDNFILKNNNNNKGISVKEVKPIR